MLRYLTHKLRTQSLNESDTYHAKTDDDRDSGTESDDEGADIEELQKYMESIIHIDHHRVHRRSKRPPQVTTLYLSPPRRARAESPPDSALPSDSDPTDPGHSSEEELEVINSASAAPKRKWGDCPVEFRCSPPADAHKPSKCLRGDGGGIPPHEFLCSVSPRKRHRRTASTDSGHAVQRPCLDFEKMQQINRVRLL